MLSCAFCVPGSSIHGSMQMKLWVSLSKTLEASHQWIPHCFREGSVLHGLPETRTGWWSLCSHTSIHSNTPTSLGFWHLLQLLASAVRGPTPSSCPTIREPHRVMVGTFPGVLASTLNLKSTMSAPMSIDFLLSSYRLYPHSPPPLSNMISVPQMLFRFMNVRQDGQVFGVLNISS